jgi:hypothetical protein
MLVCSLGEDMHINKKPLPGSTFLEAPKSGIQVFLSVVAMERQPDHGEDNFLIPGRTIKVPEQAGIRSDPKPTFTQHDETVERSDGVWVQVDQFTPKKVQNGDEKLAGRKAMTSRKMRIKADNGGIVHHQKFQIRDKGFYPVR